MLKPNMNYLRIYLLLFGICLFSCNNVEFVVRMNNKFTKDYREKGYNIYSAEQLIYFGGDSVECKFNRSFHRLNKLIPIDSTFWCSYYIAFEYFNKMQEFVYKGNARKVKNLDIISEIEYQKIKQHFDSLEILKYEQN